MKRPEDIHSIAFFGGGTGGHLFPGIAVAERAGERFPGCRCVFFRTRRKIEERVFAGTGFETRFLEIPSPRPGAGHGAAVGHWLRYLREVRRATGTARVALRDEFDLVVGLGGYASLPGILAARRERVPIILLEQNAVAGRVNVLLAPWVDAVSSSYAKTRLRLGGRLIVTGNPVRRAVVEASRAELAESPGGRKTVLVFGGSQGARGINRAIVDALGTLAEFREKIRFIHLTGPADKRFVTDAYRKHSWAAEVMDFSSQLPDLLAESDLVVARSGGTTLAEIAVIGVPAILVPYPYHRDRHQLRNAEEFARGGGACLVPESELSATRLRRLFTDVLFSPQRLAAMGAAGRRSARPQAADAVLDLAVELKKELCPSACVSSS